ncbi:mitochondrial uncoupling protein 2-like [Cimex lectularius]|uniref:Mitochondrial brown fat uncoupling protein 1 n=1 Tax=Cimex lectularius TaxID=79782 RepID=A0A8I6R6T2_CIMLE|nr:mitochondrial uncoupling protein 2-like [Cimex lectularius]XP_014240037.1 mitochondrial uncoupling protein 2-like [Cimex lectularius]
MATDNLPLQYKIMCAGSSACFADMVTFPLDTVKVRLQIQGESRALLSVAGSGMVIREGAVQYRGLVGTLTTIARTEGARSLFNGLSAGLQRQLCFSSIRIGLYDNVKATYQKLLFGESTSVNSSCRVLAGLTTGALAVFIAQPTDVVKVRFQAQLKNEIGSRYKSTLEAYKTIASKEGKAGLWKGMLPNASRNAIVNVAEIVCYDIIKETIVTKGFMKDATPCHFISAVIAGLCATIVASPVDVVKTRYMNSKPGTYKNSIKCALQTFSDEGISAFFKGFTPSFFRLVSWNIVMWVTYEKTKEYVQRYHVE